MNGGLGQQCIVLAFLAQVKARVRIETTAEATGISGVVARVLAPRLLRPLFTDELARLDQYTQTQA